MNDGLTKIPLFKITNKMSNLLDLFRKKAIAIHSGKCFTVAKTNVKKSLKWNVEIDDKKVLFESHFKMVLRNLFEIL